MGAGRWLLAVAVATPIGLSLLCDGWAKAYLFPNFSLSKMPRLEGKTAVVTGPTLHGIGHISALELARAGAHVVLAGRSEKKGQETMDAIKAEVPTASMEFLRLDLSHLPAVREAAAELLRRHRRLDILMLNAGVMACPFELTQDGYEMQFATNHLGHFLFTYLLSDLLADSAPARVVLVSSAAHMIPEMSGQAALNFSTRADVDGSSEAAYGPWVAYGRSKLANVLFAEELAERFEQAGVKVYVNALHPGGIRTNLQRHFYRTIGGTMRVIFESVMMSNTQGAITQLYAAASREIEAKGITGKYFQPQARMTATSKLVTRENRKALWDLSMQLTAPNRAWYSPTKVAW